MSNEPQLWIDMNCNLAVVPPASAVCSSFPAIIGSRLGCLCRFRAIGLWGALCLIPRGRCEIFSYNRLHIFVEVGRMVWWCEVREREPAQLLVNLIWEIIELFYPCVSGSQTRNRYCRLGWREETQHFPQSKLRSQKSYPKSLTKKERSHLICDRFLSE